MRNVKNKDLTPTPHGMQDAKWRPKSLGRLASLFALNASRDDQIDEIDQIDQIDETDQRNTELPLPGTKAFLAPRRFCLAPRRFDHNI